MAAPQFWFAASSEEFSPSQMVEQLRDVSRAGFDGVAASDHFAPWFPDGAASQAWMVLAAAGRDTAGPIGTSVTPIVHHYHPAVVAQAFMALEELYPGRAFLGAGSGEALNEVPLGLSWPSPAEQIERLDQGLEAITRLWAGETASMDAGWFKLREAKLYTCARSRPRLYVSAFGPQAAQVAARHGDGLWTLGDPEQAAVVIEAYREARARAGRDVGEIILQAGFHLASDEREAIARARRWKPTQLPEVYREDIHDPEAMQRMADERMSDEEFAHEGFLVGADVDEHIGRLRELLALEPTVVCLQLIGDADVRGSIRRYADEVLPELRTSGVRS